MGTKTQVSVEEYLRMSFDGPDREFRGGEIVERNVGENQHAMVQWRLGGLFFEFSRSKKLFGRTELRVRVGERDYLIPDFCVFAHEAPQEPYPSNPPYVVVEILSADDPMKEILDKVEIYRKWGVENIWLVNPYARSMFMYGAEGLHQVTVFRLPEYGVEIRDLDVFGA